MHVRDGVPYLGSPGLGIAATLGIATTLGLTCIAHAPEPRVLVVPVPALALAVHPEPVPPPPPPRKVAALPPAPVGTTCPADVTSIGRAIAPSDALPDNYTHLGASADPESCLIAAWTDERLYVSWDGGASFTDLARPKSTFFHVDASNDRVLVVLDDRLGVMRRGDTSPRYRTLPAPVPAGGVDQAGPWLVIPRADDVLMTGDDGLTWRTVAMPPGDTRWNPGYLSRLAADGTLVANAHETQAWIDAHPFASDGYDETRDRWYVRGASAKAWSRVSRGRAIAPRHTTRGWSYAFETDRSWGCGSSQKLVATHGSKHVEVQGELRPEVRDIALVYGSHGAFLQTYFEADGPMLAELVGAETRLTPIPYEWSPWLIGVDRAGTPILKAGSHLLRWSKSGGWRVLLSTPASSS